MNKYLKFVAPNTVLHADSPPEIDGRVVELDAERVLRDLVQIRFALDTADLGFESTLSHTIGSAVALMSMRRFGWPTEPK